MKNTHFIGHTAMDFQKLAACSRRNGNNMNRQVHTQTASVAEIKDISFDQHLLPRTSIYLFTVLVTC